MTEVSGLMARSPQLLNGKYAEVIFRDYVQGATQLPTNQVSNQSLAGAGMSGGGN